MEGEKTSLDDIMQDPSGLIGCNIEYCGEGSTNAVFKVLEYPIVLRVPKLQEVNNKDDNRSFVEAVCKTGFSNYIYELKPCFLSPKLKPVLDDILRENRRSTFKDRPLIEPTEYDSKGNFYGTWCLSPHSLIYEKGLKELIFELKLKEGYLYNSTSYSATDYCDTILESISKFKDIIGNKYPKEHECMFNRRQNDSSCSKYAKKVPLCSISFYNAILDKDMDSLKFQIRRLLGCGESYFIITKNTINKLESDQEKDKLCDIMSRAVLQDNLFQLLYAYQCIDILGIKRACLLYQILTEETDDSFTKFRYDLINEYIHYCNKNSLGYNDNIESVKVNYSEWIQRVFFERVQDLIPKIHTDLRNIRRTTCSCDFSVYSYDSSSVDSVDSPKKEFSPFIEKELNESIPVIVLMQLFLLSKTFVDSSVIFTMKEKPKLSGDGDKTRLYPRLDTGKLRFCELDIDGIKYKLNTQLVDVDAKRFTHIINWRKYIKLE